MRRLALSLPGVSEGRGEQFAFTVERNGKAKGFVWVWLERVHPKKARVPNPEVLAVRVRDETEKVALLAGDADIFFTEPHYNGFPAVLVRLRAVTDAQLRDLIANAWRCLAPKALLADIEKQPARNARGPRTPRARRRPRR